MSECAIPRLSKPEDGPPDWSDVRRSSYNVIKLFFAFEYDCSSQGLMLDIIAFLLYLARENRSFLPLSPLVSNLDVTLNDTSTLALLSERSEVFPDPSTLSRSESSPDPSRWCWSVRTNVYSPSLKGSDGVTFAISASAFRPSSPVDSFRFLVCFS